MLMGHCAGCEVTGRHRLGKCMLGLQGKALRELLPRIGMCGRCLGVFMLGKAANMSIYRSKRGPMADKVTWRD